MEQKVIQIGNSAGLIIPKTLMEQVGLKEGSQVVIEKDPSSDALTIVKKGSTVHASSITPEFMKIIEKVNKRYGKALKELAQA